MSIRKLFLSLTFSLLALCAFAQGEICREICGAKFGDSYTNVKNILERKFGEPNSYETDKNGIVYDNISYGGVFFSTVIFDFQYSSLNYSYFNRCIMICNENDANAAIRRRDNIKRILERKYIIYEGTDGNGFKYYAGGKTPQQDKYGFTIDILKYKDGTYGVRLDYVPYKFIDEEF